MMELSDIKASLRAGRYSWPGSYPLFFVAGDCSAVCFNCVRSGWREVVDATINLGACFDSWQMVAVEANWEDPHLFCEHCGERIESAYAEDA